jgi:hypothetical protein
VIEAYMANVKLTPNMIRERAQGVIVAEVAKVRIHSPHVGYLRVEPTTNNQAKGVHWAEDFEMRKVMERE